MKFILLVDSTLVIITIYLVCLIYGEEDFLKKYINFTIFTPKLFPHGVGGHEMYNPIDATYQIWLRLIL